MGNAVSAMPFSADPHRKWQKCHLIVPEPPVTTGLFGLDLWREESGGVAGRKEGPPPASTPGTPAPRNFRWEAAHVARPAMEDHPMAKSKTKLAKRTGNASKTGAASRVEARGDTNQLFNWSRSRADNAGLYSAG